MVNAEYLGGLLVATENRAIGTNKKKVVLCLISTDLVENHSGWRLSIKAQSIGMGYTRAYCLANQTISENFEIQSCLFDASQPTNDIVHSLEQSQPYIVVFCSPERLVLQNNWHTYNETMVAAEAVRKRLPKTQIILAGPPFYSASEQLERHPFADIVIQGESELTMEDYLLSRIYGRSLDNVLGLTFRENDRITFTGVRQECIDPANVPDIFNDEYFDNFYGTFVCQTSFGCPYRCAYCPSAGFKYREVPLDRVKQSLKKALSHKNITNIVFFDTDLAHNTGRFHEILEFLMKHNARKIPVDGFWGSLPKIEPYLKTMRAAGFIRHIRVSVQTATPEVLRLSRRNWLTPTMLSKFSPSLVANFPDARVELILGLPGETPDSFRKGMLEFFKLGFRVFGIYTLMLSPGSEFHKRREELGLQFYNTIFPFVTRTPHFSQGDLDRARRFAYRFSVLAQLVQPEDLPLFQSHGIDLIDLAEKMEELELQCKDNLGGECCTDDAVSLNDIPAYVSGACFDDVSSVMLDKVVNFIKERYDFPSVQDAKYFHEYIMVKHNIHTFERHANESLKQRLETSQFPLLHAYAEIKANPVIQKMLGLNPSGGVTDSDLSTCFVVFSISKMRAVPVTVENTAMFRKLLFTLSHSKSFQEIFSEFSIEMKLVVMKSIVAIQNAGLIDINLD